MPAPNATWVSAGGEAFFWTFLNSGLHMIGAEGLTAADTGESGNMKRHQGFTSGEFKLGDAVSVDVPGDDGVVAAFIFPSDQAPEFDLSFSVFDGDFYTGTSGLEASTIGEALAYPVSSDAVTPQSLAALMTRRTKQVGDIGSGDATGYEHLLLLSPDIYFIGAGGFANKAHNDVTYRVKCNSSSYYIDGRPISTVFPTAPNGRAAAIILRTVGRYNFACLVGNASETGILTTHKPSATTAKHVATVETTGFATTSVSGVVTTAPYEVTLGSAPGAGKFAIVGYELSGGYTLS